MLRVLPLFAVDGHHQLRYAKSNAGTSNDACGRPCVVSAHHTEHLTTSVMSCLSSLMSISPQQCAPAPSCCLSLPGTVCLLGSALSCWLPSSPCAALAAANAERTAGGSAVCCCSWRASASASMHRCSRLRTCSLSACSKHRLPRLRIEWQDQHVRPSVS